MFILVWWIMSLLSFLNIIHGCLQYFSFFMASFCLVCCCSPHVRPKALIERVWLCGKVGNVEGSVTKLFPSLVPVPAENLRAASYFPYDFSLHSTLPAALFCP